jgi:hypothetical protein
MDTNTETATVPGPTRASAGRRATPAALLVRLARTGTTTRHWTRCLVALGAGLLTLNVLSAYPGFMSLDSVTQLGQALDPSTLDDWHPPVMTALWWLLMELTSERVGSMLVAQLLVLWASLTALAVFVFQGTGRRRLSLVPLSIGLLPHVAGTSAAIWKDTHLAFALLGGVVLLLFVRRGIRRALLRWSAVATVVLLLAYAGAVRYNALPAIVPLLFLLVWPGARPRRRHRALLAAVAVTGGLVATPVINAVRPVEATHPAASIMLDDVLHLYSARELATSDVSPPLRDHLVRLATACPPETRDINFTWRCANGTGDIPAFFSTHSHELRELYLKGIVQRPLRYAQFRLGVFADFLYDPPEERYIARFTIRDNPLGLTFEPNVASRALEYYVDATTKNTGLVYMPWPWFLASLAVMALAWRRRAWSRHAGVVMALGASAAVYVLTYLPLVIGYDYRYVYWSAVAVSIAAVLLVLERRATPSEPTPDHLDGSPDTDAPAEDRTDGAAPLAELVAAHRH